jgi:hypothetical protein
MWIDSVKRVSFASEMDDPVCQRGVDSYTV